MVLVALTVVVWSDSKQEKPLTVETALVQVGRVEETVSCNGVVEAGELTGVYASCTCILEEVTVQVGQRVKAGDVLATVDKEATKALQLSGDRLSDALSLSAMNTEICAPTEGIVVSVDAVDGGMADPSVPCVTIAAYEDLQVRVMIREKLLPTLEVGQSVKVSGAGFDRDVYTGKLSEIAAAVSNLGDGESVVEGVVTLDDGMADDSMCIGLSAKVKVVVSAVDDGLLVPYESVVKAENGDSFVVVVQDGKAKYCPIGVIGERAGGVLVRNDGRLIGKELVLRPENVREEGQRVQSRQGGVG